MVGDADVGKLLHVTNAVSGQVPNGQVRRFHYEVLACLSEAWAEVTSSSLPACPQCADNVEMVYLLPPYLLWRAMAKLLQQKALETCGEFG